MSKIEMVENGSERMSGFARWDGRKTLLALLAVLAVTAGVFWRGLEGQFVYDDLLLIERNPSIKGLGQGLAHLGEIFGGSYWNFLDERTAQGIGYWRPLSALYLALGYWIGEGSALGFHALSLLAHLAATWAAFRLATRLSGDARVGLGAALLFGLHPVQVESVAWASAVNTPLAGLFSLLALDAFLAWRQAGSRGLPWGACAAFLLGLGCKETSVAVVPLAIALDLARSLQAGRSAWSPLWRAYAGFVAVGLVYYAARVMVFGTWGAGLERITTDFDVSAARLGLLRIELLGGFLGLLAWPLDLETFRPFRPELSLLDPSLLLALFSLALLSVLMVLALRRRASLFLAALTIVPAALLPVIVRVESLGVFPLSDRFTYLSVFGWALLIAALMQRIEPRKAAAVVGVLALGYATLSWQRVRVWQDEETLFRSAVSESPDTPYVHWGLGRVLLEDFRTQGDPARLAEARAAFERAQDLCEAVRLGEHRVYATSHDTLQSNLGLGWSLTLEAQTQRVPEHEAARLVFLSVTRSYPGSEEGFTGLGVVEYHSGNYAEAKAALRRALEINPKYAEAHFNLGLVLLENQELGEARAHLERNLELRSDHVPGLIWLAGAVHNSGDTGAAVDLAQRARAIAPDNPEPLMLLGELNASLGHWNEALRWFDRALQADAGNGRAYLEQAKTLIALDQKESAISSLIKACGLMPRNFEAHYNLSALALAEGRVHEVLPYTVRAYELSSDDPIGERLAQLLSELATAETDLPTDLATIDYHKKRYDQALVWTRRVLAERPNDGRTLLVHGLILIKQGQLDEAADALRRACPALPGDFRPRHELGELLLELGRKEEALPYLEQALELLGEEGADDGLRRAVRGSIQTSIEVLRGG